MPKSPNQKLKLLYLMKILQEKTDENHLMSVQQMINELAFYHISAERKSIYDDIEALRLYGVDIVNVKSKTTGYYVANRIFQLPELKLLVDLVQVSKFITHKKSEELIKKLESFASQYDAQKLQRQVYVANRIKTMNETIYYNVDAIHLGINENKKIEFRYFEYNADKKRVCKNKNKSYRISPFALACDDENYYMLGFDSEQGIIKHYRVDKMERINVIDEKRDGIESFNKIDMATYSKKTFSMFGGQEAKVTLQFANSLMGVVVDRFGKDVSTRKEGTEHFIAHVTVTLSPQFYGWLAGLGGGVKILSPKSVRESYLSHIQTILEANNEDTRCYLSMG